MIEMIMVTMPMRCSEEKTEKKATEKKKSDWSFKELQVFLKAMESD